MFSTNINRKQKKMISLGALLALTFFTLLPYRTHAIFVDFVSSISDSAINWDNAATQVATSLEQRYGFTKDVWRTAQRKGSAPRVEISFDNTNPKVGEKVTAHAIPEFFKNDPQNLYYTWYIIHTTDGTPQTATNSIKKGKIEAAKIMAQDDYDPDLDGQNYSDSGEDPDKDGWPSVDDNSYDPDVCAAPMGGADGKGGLEEDSENIDATLSEYCGTESTAADCNLYTTKDSFNLYYTFNGSQGNSYCSTCSSETLSWGTLSSNNQCCYLVQNPSDTTYAGYDSGTNYCPSSYDSAYESCFDYDTLKSTNETAINDCLDSKYNDCKDAYDEIHGNSSTTQSTNVDVGTTTEEYSRCFKHNFGTSTGALGYRGYEGSTGTYDNDESGKDYNTPCKHKWEDAPGYTSGSGKLTTGEEEYWKTDPTDPDTDGDGFLDGADIIGLGQEDFTWTYQKGDRVGVVVEGTSMIPTDETNAYYKIMWGYPDTCDSTKTGLLADDKCDNTDDYGFGFLATKAPGEEGEDKLKVSLSYIPDNPVADPSDDNKDNIESDGTINDADRITVTSSLDNTDLSPSTLYYTWQIQKGTLGDEDSWTEVNIEDNFNSPTNSSGLGLTSFSFAPKTSVLKGNDDIVYFKVTLTVSRSSGTESKRGRSSVTIPVNKKGIKLKFYKVDVKDGKATLGDEVCDEEPYKTICPVVHNQMLAAKISGSNYTSSNSEFSWSINGTSYPTPSDPSDLFDGWSDTIIFFPIIESAGETLEVSVTATSKSELQPVTSSRFLSAINPTVYIKTYDSSSSWAKTYTAEDESQPNSTQEISSSDAFEALTDTEVSYYLSFAPDYLLSNDSNTVIDWQINGTSISDEDFSESDLDLSGVTTENNNQTLKFTTGDTEGTYYTLGATVKQYWSADEQNILSTAWGITPETLKSDASVTVATVASSSKLESKSASMRPGQILAAMGTHLPHYFMYILRLSLTMLVMFFMSAGFYGLTLGIGLKTR